MKQKAISAVLVASMLLSMSGCALFDKDDKAVLAVVKEYANAMVNADAGDIVDFMLNGDDYEKEFKSYFNTCTGKSKDVCEAIADTMSYQIINGSVHSSKKDKRASVEIVYTMVDYEEIYENVSDDNGNIYDFIDEIEADGGNTTIEIKQKIDLVFKHDEWLVDDDDNENFYELFEYYKNVSEYDWCHFDVISIEDFHRALKNALGRDYDEDCYIYDDSISFYGVYAYYAYYEAECTFMIYEYSEQSLASSYFEDLYNAFLDDIENGNVEGAYIYYFDRYKGYLLINGKIDGKESYGGYYLKDDTVLGIVVYDPPKNAYNVVDSILDSLGYTGPADCL
ncbi:MAG: hypothetical protein IKH82_02715 [Clostridiales bacterium]|nr:hypothetical protein [Clostridiales bacterium]